MDSNFKDSVLGVPFYRFYYDESKVDAIYQSVRQLKYRENDTNWLWDGVKEDGIGGSDLYKLPEFAELFSWMQGCMDRVAQDMRVSRTCRLSCCSAWCNLNKPGEFLYDHVHPNTFIASNFYTSGHSKDATVYVHHNPYFHSTNVRPCGDGDKFWLEDTYYLVHKEPTDPGKVVVFPPLIRHYSEPNTSKEDRITIAANWFPTGLMNAGNVSHLNVEVLK